MIKKHAAVIKAGFHINIRLKTQETDQCQWWLVSCFADVIARELGFFKNKPFPHSLTFDSLQSELDLRLSFSSPMKEIRFCSYWLLSPHCSKWMRPAPLPALIQSTSFFFFFPKFSGSLFHFLSFHPPSLCPRLKTTWHPAFPFCQVVFVIFHLSFFFLLLLLLFFWAL